METWWRVIRMCFELLATGGQALPSAASVVPGAPLAARTSVVLTSDGENGEVGTLEWMSLPGRRVVAISRARGVARFFEGVGTTLREGRPVRVPTRTAAVSVLGDSLWLTDYGTGTSWGTTLQRLLEKRADKSAFSRQASPALDNGLRVWARMKGGWLALEGVTMVDDEKPDRELPVVRISTQRTGIRYDTLATIRVGAWLFRVDEHTALPYQPLSDGDLVAASPDGELLVVARRRLAARGAVGVEIGTWVTRTGVARHVDLRIPALPVDQATVIAARQEVRERLAGAPVPPSVVEDALGARLYVPPYRSPVSAISADVLHRVFVSTTLQTGTTVRVLDRKLRIVGVCRLSPRERIVATGAEAFWTLDASPGGRAAVLREYGGCVVREPGTVRP